MSSCSCRLAVLFAATVTTSAAAQTFERRAADLVGRMTLEEKVSQMMDRAPAIERLGIPEYNWWNEGLHGVARSGLATVFPQAIGFAATWNDSLVLRMASVISDEFRAKLAQEKLIDVTLPDGHTLPVRSEGQGQDRRSDFAPFSLRDHMPDGDDAGAPVR